MTLILILTDGDHCDFHWRLSLTNFATIRTSDGGAVVTLKMNWDSYCLESEWYISGAQCSIMTMKILSSAYRYAHVNFYTDQTVSFQVRTKQTNLWKKYLMGGTSALVLNSVNCTALSVLPLVWMSQKNLCLQHFFLKGWDEAREIHAYPPGENNSTSFWIIFMMTVLMRILFTIITIHIMVKTFCVSVGEERSLQKVRILRICRLCRPKSCEVDFSFIHLLCIWNSCWNIAQTFK